MSAVLQHYGTDLAAGNRGLISARKMETPCCNKLRGAADSDAQPRPALGGKPSATGEGYMLIFHGARYSRVVSLLASSSPRIFSSLASQRIFLPVSMEIRQRWPGIVE